MRYTEKIELQTRRIHLILPLILTVYGKGQKIYRLQSGCGVGWGRDHERNAEIPEARVEALPNVKTCVKHSMAGKVAGYQVITGKDTYTELQISSQEEVDKLYDLGSRKGQGPTEGMLGDVNK